MSTDQRVMLNGFYSAEDYPVHLRRIRFHDPETGKTLVFLTNNTALPALVGTALYPVLVHRPADSIHASSPQSVTLMQLRFTSLTVTSL